MRNDLIIGDCIEIMREMPDKSIDLIFADPPYNAKNIGPNNRTYSLGQMQLPREEYEEWCHEWFEEAFRLTDRLLITPGIANTHCYPQPNWILAWHKPAAVSFNRNGGFNVWEPIFVYGKTPSGSHLPHDHLLFNTKNLGNPIERQHPCPKPLALMRKLISIFSLEGETVLDPFSGSGTTLRAAKDLGRNYIGIDINPAYIEICRKRVAQEVML